MNQSIPGNSKKIYDFSIDYNSVYLLIHTCLTPSIPDNLPACLPDCISVYQHADVHADHKDGWMGINKFIRENCILETILEKAAGRQAVKDAGGR